MAEPGDLVPPDGEAEGPPRDDALERLEEKIERLKDPERGDTGLSRGFVVVMSIAVLGAGCLWGSFTVGNYLSKTYGSSLYLPVTIVAGMVAAASMAYRLLRPLLEDR